MDLWMLVGQLVADHLDQNKQKSNFDLKLMLQNWKSLFITQIH